MFKKIGNVKLVVIKIDILFMLKIDFYSDR